MKKGLKIFTVLVAASLVLIAAVGGAVAYNELINTPSESDAVGDWKLSSYKGYDYGGNEVKFSMKDGIASEYGLKITSSDNGIVVGEYLGVPFKGTIRKCIFETDFMKDTVRYHMTGYMDDKNHMHVGILTLNGAEVSSSMSIYNRDGSRTPNADDFRSITGDWSVNKSVDNGSPEKITTISVKQQDYSICRGTIQYESGKDLVFSGYIDTLMLGGTHHGMIIDTEGNIWTTLSTRGQIRLMNYVSEYLMTMDGGNVTSYAPADLGGTSMHNSEGQWISVASQEGYTISGTVYNGTDYVLSGNYFYGFNTLLKVKLSSPTTDYYGFLLSENGVMTINALDAGGNALILRFDQGGAA